MLFLESFDIPRQVAGAQQRCALTALIASVLSFRWTLDLSKQCTNKQH